MIPAKFHHYFNLEGRRDVFPAIAAFKTLSRAAGDPIDADYEKLMWEFFAAIDPKNQRRQRGGITLGSGKSKRFYKNLHG